MDKEALIKTKEYVMLLLVILGVYIGFKYISPLITPFLFAFAIVAFFYPMLVKLQRKLHIKKGFLTAGILFLLCTTLGIGIWSLVVFIFHRLSDILGQMDIFEEKFCLFIGGCCDGLEQRFGLNGDGIETFILDNVNVFIENFEVQIVPKLMNRSWDYVKDIVGVVGFLVIMIIGAVLLAKDYGVIKEKIYGCRELKNIVVIVRKIFVHIGTFAKAQLIIMSIISTLAAVVLFAGGIEGGIFLGIITGFMDMLPFIGTGIILMPLAFWQILNGYYIKAGICVILYVICALTREFLEPKLIGEKMGIFPVAILFSVYVGVKLFGTFGILKGPLALITIIEIYGFIKEKWSEEKDEKNEECEIQD